MNIFRPVAVIFILASLAGFIHSSSAQQSASTNDAPASVFSAFKKAWPKASIIAVSKETAEGKDYYKVQSTEGKTQRNIYYTPTGEAVETEESIEPANLPVAIKKYLTKKYPNGSIIGGVFAKSKDASGYQLDIQNGKKKISIAFDGKGKLLK
jgi:hypothetical protein